jgi:putative transposase
MIKKYQNKYRIESARLKNWDYGSNGAYFVTICTKNREHYFGEIENKKMILSELGKVAYEFWEEIPNHFPFVELGNFVIMPNHLHGILIIDKNAVVQTRLIASQPLITSQPGGITGNHNPMFHDNISRIIRWYKGRCSFETRKTHTDFGWQSRFHDHIIRNDSSFNRIQNYIETNPENWKEDKLQITSYRISF